MLTNLYVSAQMALPDWARGRGLAVFLPFIFGATTADSAVWRKLTAMEGLPIAYFVAAAVVVLGVPDLALETSDRRLDRDGAHAWGLHEDVADVGRFIEPFTINSWLEVMQHRERVTNADEMLKNLSSTSAHGDAARHV